MQVPKNKHIFLKTLLGYCETVHSKKGHNSVSCPTFPSLMVLLPGDGVYVPSP